MDPALTSTPIHPDRSAPPDIPLRSWTDRAGPAGAYTILVGTLTSLVGISWDVQWHIEVGPDTFFTLSHLMLYSGSALAGIASLVMVVRATFAQRAGRAVDPTVGGSPVRVFGGTFTAPLGYLIAGTGAALFLLYGLMDLWWHSLYGFDAVLDSPPHVALFITVSLTMLGSVIVFSAARTRRWGRIGFIVSIPVLMTFCPFTTSAFGGLSQTVDPQLAGNVFFAVCLVLMGAMTLRRQGTALWIAAVLGAMQGFLWWFSPWAAEWYAGYVGLPMRDNLVDMAPEVPSGIPMFLGVAALAFEALFWFGRRYDWSARRLAPAVGAVGGVLVSLSMLVQQHLLGGGDGGSIGQGGGTSMMSTGLTDAFLGLVCGMLAGYLAARFAVLLHLTTPSTEHRQEGR